MPRGVCERRRVATCCNLACRRLPCCATYHRCHCRVRAVIRRAHRRVPRNGARHEIRGGCEREHRLHKSITHTLTRTTGHASVTALAPHTSPRHASAGSHTAACGRPCRRHREAGGEGGGGRTKSSTKSAIIDSRHPCCAGPARRLAAASGAESSSGIPGAVGAVPAAPGAPEPTAAMRSRGRSIPASPSSMLLPRRLPTLAPPRAHGGGPPPQV